MATSPAENRLPPGSLVGQFVSEIRNIPLARDVVLHALLPEEFRNLPEQVAQLAAELHEFRDDTTRRLDTLETGQGRMQDDIADLRQGQSQMRDDIRLLRGQVGNLRGESYEEECARRIKLVMVEYFADVTLADRSWIDDRLVSARQNARLTRAQFDQIRAIDIIAQGRLVGSQHEILAAIEVSVTINEQDVRNAQLRATLLESLTGQSARAFCVANVHWSDALAESAYNLDVTLIHYELPGYNLDGVSQ